MKKIERRDHHLHHLCHSCNRGVSSLQRVFRATGCVLQATCLSCNRGVSQVQRVILATCHSCNVSSRQQGCPVGHVSLVQQSCVFWGNVSLVPHSCGSSASSSSSSSKGASRLHLHLLPRLNRSSSLSLHPGKSALWPIPNVLVAGPAVVQPGLQHFYLHVAHGGLPRLLRRTT